MKIVIFSDGGARGNPGPAAIGVIIENDTGKSIKKISRYIGETTNNQAEYQALLAGLAYAKDLKPEEVNCYLDSELVVKQLNGEYKVKDKDLAAQFIKIWNLVHDFKKVVFHHVPREKNKKADALVNSALDRRAEEKK
ncbi:MAG TPA: ribonuclease HI family protein [Candidatus Bipolaricaulota bacterium]|nr:ribonuclease HI family protein [Candidatus Bipolaricaulota bacterium]